MFQHSIPLSFILGGTIFFAGIFGIIIMLDIRLPYDWNGDISIFFNKRWNKEELTMLAFSLVFFFFGLMIIFRLEWARKALIILISMGMLVSLGLISYNYINNGSRRILETIGLSMLILIPQFSILFFLTQEKIIAEFPQSRNSPDLSDDLLDS